MKNKDSILILIEKSTNAFGELKGLTKDEKLKAALAIIQDTIQTAFGINPDLLTPETIADTLVKKMLDNEQISLLTNLLWTQAEIALKLSQPIEGLTRYENSLLLLQWQTHQSADEIYLENQNKITALKAVIDELKPTRNQLDYNFEIIKINEKF